MRVVGSRTATAAVALVVSAAASVALAVYLDTLLLFLFVPFVPLLFRGGDGREDPEPTRECPECGWRTTDTGYEYCPRDGRRLRNSQK